jgi:hypothetical protein
MTGSMGTARECPDCHKTYGPDYNDTFCACGAELRQAADTGTSSTNASGPSSSGKSSSPGGSSCMPPAIGTACLVVYSADKQPLHYQPLDRDITLIGRTDAIGGTFPDLDLGQFFDEATARKVSRKHALILRSRETGGYVLRPLAKNTGTQVEREMAADMQDYPMTDGTRIILGGQVRMKFEIVK